MKEFLSNNIKEITFIFRKGKYIPPDPKDRGKPGFERCVELPWIVDKVKQFGPQEGNSLFDFGCNKASYILDFKRQYKLQTYGIDAKRQGKKYVDHFYSGLFDKRLKRKIRHAGPYDICTAISAIEHAGAGMHPNAQGITDYQREICDFMIQSSKACFISVPFGRRPGWAKDKSRRNLYQFDNDMLDHIRGYAISLGYRYLEEIYKFSEGLWIKVHRNNVQNCRYRDNKSGASAIALISAWKSNDEF